MYPSRRSASVGPPPIVVRASRNTEGAWDQPPETQSKKQLAGPNPESSLSSRPTLRLGLLILFCPIFAASVAELYKRHRRAVPVPDYEYNLRRPQRENWDAFLNIELSKLARRETMSLKDAARQRVRFQSYQSILDYAEMYRMPEAWIPATILKAKDRGPEAIDVSVSVEQILRQP